MNVTPAALAERDGSRAIRRVVIVGGGTAGWMTAAPLAQLFERTAPGQPRCEVVLIESPDIATIGVGEATIPTIRQYNRALGLDPTEFLRRTQASFKLGIEFKDWGRLGHRFFHGFGDFGPAIEGRTPWQHWLRLRDPADTTSYEDWSTASVMSRHFKFTPPEAGPPSAANAFSYAVHFDASLYAGFLREHAIRHGAQRVEGTIVEVEQRPDDGFVAAVKLKDGRRIDGDLFVDCSGLRALLIQGVMQSGYEDWSKMLPVNSAQAVPCSRSEPLRPYTTSHARAAGWTWHIPLQHRTGMGHVYCNEFTTDEEAGRVLMEEALDGEALAAPQQIRFKTGRRSRAWIKNVVAIGLSSGFLEPLESTSIHLILDNVGSLIHFFPDRDFQPTLAAEFNRKVAFQFECIRDFIILHYKLTERTDTEFWRYVAQMPIPETLERQIALFRESGRVLVNDPNGFTEPSWVSLYFGLGLWPQRLDPFVHQLPEAALRTHFDRVRQAIAGTVARMPGHGQFLADVWSVGEGGKAPAMAQF